MKALYGYISIEERKADKRARLIEFFKTNNRNPREDAESTEERELAHFMRHAVRRDKDAEIIEYYDGFCKYKRITDDEFIDIYEAFCKENGHRPSNGKNSSQEECALAQRAAHMCKHPRMIAINEQYGFKWRNCKHMPNTDMREYRKQYAKDFIAKNGYLPTHNNADPEEKATANYWSRYLDTDEEMKALYAKTPTKAQYMAMQTKERLKKYLIENKKKPTKRPLRDDYQRYKNDEDVIEIVKTFENV